MNEKNILFQLTTNLSFQRNKATPKVSLRPPLPDAEELAEPKSKKLRALEVAPHDESDSEEITILSGVTQINSKEKKKQKRSAGKVKNLKQIERERVR